MLYFDFRLFNDQFPTTNRNHGFQNILYPEFREEAEERFLDIYLPWQNGFNEIKYCKSIWYPYTYNDTP